MNMLEEFRTQFKPLLFLPKYQKHEYDRWNAFEFIASEFCKKNGTLKIIETGTLRSSNNWLGYGHSTLIFDWIVSKMGGIVYSVDIDHEAIKFARGMCKNVHFVNCDSVGFLRNADAADLDLLYLDSYDWSFEKHLSSCLHHMTELGAIWDRIPSGCLIAIDDCHTENDGKHVLVHSFFEKMLRLKPLINCHVQIWRKP